MKILNICKVEMQITAVACPCNHEDTTKTEVFLDGAFTQEQATFAADTPSPHQLGELSPAVTRNFMRRLNSFHDGFLRPAQICRMRASRVKLAAGWLVGRRRDFPFKPLCPALVIGIERRDRRKQSLGVRVLRRGK